MSQRILVVGVSESGKSTLVKRMLEKVKIPVFVRDPLFTQWPNMTGRFDDSDELREHLNMLKKHPCVVVIDEAAEFFSVSQRENHWIFSRGRHEAMLPIAIAQRLKMMAPNVREQATDLYVFNSGVEASKILAEEYNMPDLLAAPELSQGEYFLVKWQNGERVCTAHALW